MAKLVVDGGQRLNGAIDIAGSKNSALALMVAAALGTQDVVLEGVPRYADVPAQVEILRALGARVECPESGVFVINGEDICVEDAPYELVRRLRASFYVSGLLLARLGRARVPLPGGDPFGTRPVDFHIKGFQALGAQTAIEHGYLVAQVSNLFGRLCGARFQIPRASFGTTINLLLAGALADGTTHLENAAREPEIVDLAMLLNKMGARIKGAGTDTIVIEGVGRLGGARHEVIPDRLEAGTYLIGAALTGGDVFARRAVPEHLRALLAKLEEAGAEATEDDSGVRVRVHPGKRLRAVDVETRVFPGFATDFQAPFVALMSVADGVSLVREAIFADRVEDIDELRRMGANIRVEGATAIILGGTRLTGAAVEAPDIRAGAALVLAGLAAEGTTEVHGVHHVDRGYEQLEERLALLNVNVRRRGDADDVTLQQLPQELPNNPRPQ